MLDAIQGSFIIADVNPCFLEGSRNHVAQSLNRSIAQSLLKRVSCLAPLALATGSLPNCAPDVAGEAEFSYTMREVAVTWALPADTAWEAHARQQDDSAFGGSDPVCDVPVPRALDASYWELAGTATAVVAEIVDTGGLETLSVYRTDLRTDMPTLDRFVLEAMFREELPSETPDPVALALGESSSLPTIPNGSGSEHGIAVLYDDGDIRMYGPNEAGMSSGSRPWSAGYGYTGLIAPPSLPEGVTNREYCDIEILPDGDIVVTFAQAPGITIGPETYLREGWIRYNHATSTWESPVTAYLGTEFFHREKDSQFAHTSCMSVDTNYYADYEIVFASNRARTSGGTIYNQYLWNFDLNTSGLFAINWAKAVPTPAGYGDLQGVAVLDGSRVLVQHDYEVGSHAPDRVRLLNVSGSPIVELDQSSHRTELHGVTVLPAGADATCDYWLALSAFDSGEPNVPGVGEACASFFAAQVTACD